MSITGDLIDTATTVDQVTLSNLNNILSVKNYGITQLQIANNAIYDRSIVSMTYNKITSSPQQLVDLIAVTPTLNYTLGTNGTNIILRSPVDQLAALGAISSAQIASTYLPLIGGTMTGSINMGTQKITGLGTPTLSTDACTKAYSDLVTVTQGLNILVTGTGQSKQVAGNPQLTGITSMTFQSYSPTVTTMTMLKSGGGSSYFIYLPASPPTYATSTKYVLAMQSGGGCTWIDPQILTSSNANITITGNIITLEPVLTNISSLTMAGNLVMNGNKITSLALPTDPGDSCNKEYVDSFAYVTPASLATTLAAYMQKSGSTMSGILTMNANIITGVGMPLFPTDAVNKIYADAITTTTASNLATTVANYLPLVGGTLSGNLSMGTHLITNVLAPISPTDAANKATVDAVYTWTSELINSLLTGYVNKSGSTMTGQLNMANNYIINVADPIWPKDCANKNYVDLLASGFKIKPVVHCLMSTTGGYTYSNGIAGFGATLIKMNSTSVGLNVDSYILNNGDRILVNTTTTPAYNGVYQLTTNGLNGQNTVLTRAADTDGTPLIELHPGATFFVQNGSIYGGYQYTQTSEIPTTVGTDSITYSPITAPSSVTAGSNIIVYQNEVELNPTVTGLNSIQFTSGSGYVNISKAIGGSNYNLILPPSGSAGNQFLVYDNYGVANWTTAPSSAGTYTAGSNLSLTSGVFSVNSNLTAINSMQLKEANSSGLVILGKKAGSASYSLNLPAAAPTTNTYLKYDGADYTWSTAGSSSLIAFQYLHVSSVSLVTVSTNSFIAWNQMVGFSGNSASLTSPTQFTLLPGFNYKCTAMIEIPGVEMVLNWYSITGSVIFGSAADAGVAGRGNLAIGFITPSVTTIVSLQCLWTPGGNSTTDAYNKQPWAIIEVISSNVAVSQFTGATQSLPGTAGFIPAPLAGTQNSYLRGDGNWVSANNGPTAAIYLFALNTTSGYVASMNNPIPFPVIQSQSGIGGVISYTSPFSNFTLQVGNVYKLTAGCNYATVAGPFQWATNMGGAIVFVGVAGNANNINSIGTAIAYVTPTFVTTVGVYPTIAGLTLGYSSISGLAFWMSIEVVSNNNQISAFTGATSVTNGTVGYIPAPTAGTQNSYLRGDGNWVQANNGPTAAQYLQVTNTANITVPAGGQPYPFANILKSTGNSITQPTTTTFLLLAGSTYKCTASIGPATSVVQGVSVTYIWSIASGTFGTTGIMNTTYYCTQAVGYITAVVDTTIYLLISSTNWSPVSSGNASFALIEVVSNNNTITAFGGATSSADGAIGYIPKPLTGQQNYVLTGSGGWSAPINKATQTVKCYIETSSWVATFPNKQIINLTIPSIIDGVTLVVGDKVLVNLSFDSSVNGCFAVTEIISGGFALTRIEDYSAVSQFLQGSIIYVANGTLFGGSLFIQSSIQPTILGTSAITYTQYTGVPIPKSWYNDAGGTSAAALVSGYISFGLGVGGIGSGSSGTAINKVPGLYVYQLTSGKSYRVRFFCDIYSASSSTSGSFYIVKSTSSTLPTSPSLSTDTIGSLHATNSTLSSYYKVDVVGYITTSVTTYIGVRYGGTAGPAQIANSVIEINLL